MKQKLILATLLIISLSLTSCSGSKRAAKKCGCPHWGKLDDHKGEVAIKLAKNRNSKFQHHLI
ncbi:MAG: hypothetical protein IPI52_05510 [Bacteroidetes bacterium]|nr:hypothetical protein [Bacteroidota bacterium]